VRAVHIREIGPLFVTWCDDGSVWAKGTPPLHHLVRLDTFPGAPRLKGFFRLCERINACVSQRAVDALAEELVRAHRESPYWPYLRQWLAHRVDMLARGQVVQPLGWGDPRRMQRR
jgi:hypothetical protein